MSISSSGSSRISISSDQYESSDDGSGFMVGPTMTQIVSFGLDREDDMQRIRLQWAQEMDDGIRPWSNNEPIWVDFNFDFANPSSHDLVNQGFYLKFGDNESIHIPPRLFRRWLVPWNGRRNILVPSRTDIRFEVNIRRLRSNSSAFPSSDSNATIIPCHIPLLG